MDTLIVKKTGLYVSEYSKREKKVHSYIPYLNNVIKFDKDIVFEDFFKYIMKDPKNYSMVFSSHLGHFSLDEWSKEWQTISTKPETEIDYLCVHWNAEYIDWSNRVRKHNFAGSEFEITDIHKKINITADFSGYGKKKKNELSDDKNAELVNVAFALETIPINELRLIPFKLNTDFQLFELDTSKILAHGLLDFTVYDVIGAVLFEISFAGSPVERDIELKKIKDAYNDVKNFF